MSFLSKKTNQKFNNSNKKRKLNIDSNINFFDDVITNFVNFKFFFRFCYVIVFIFWHKIIRIYFISRFDKRYHEIWIDINFRTTSFLFRFHHFFVLRILNSISFSSLRIKKFEINVKLKTKNLRITFIRDFRRQMRMMS